MNKLFNGIERSGAKIGNIRLRRNSPVKSGKPPKKIRGLNILSFFSAAALSFAATIPAHATSFSKSVRSTAAPLAPQELLRSGFVDVLGGASVNRTSGVQGISVEVNRAARVVLAPSGESVSSVVVAAPRATYIDERLVDLELQANTYAVLDDNERRRLEAFRALRRGWDFGSGERLNPDSLRSFDRFFAPGGFVPSEMSVFMSSDGNIVANWIDIHGVTIELEFLKDRISYFKDSEEDSRILPLSMSAEVRRILAKDLDS